MPLTLSLAVSSRDLEILMEAMGTLDAEYGLDDAGRDLWDRVRDARDTVRKAEED
jgi:hypothetical protein